VRIEARPVDGTRPAQWLVRCFADGLKAPVTLLWRFPAGVKQIGGAVPRDEPTALVQPPDRGPSWAECEATGSDGVPVHANHPLAPIAAGAGPVTARAGDLVTVRGSGFGPSPNPGDAVWLVPPGPGRALVADARCKGASWSELAVSVCVPTAARGRTWQVRVQAAETLATAPKPLVVAP